jgi:hypothetical protein
MLISHVELLNKRMCASWHMHARGHHGWQQFMTWPKSRAGSYLTLASSSTRMPQRTHRGWPEHYPIVHPWSEVRYCPTYQHTKYSVWGFNMSHMRQYTTQTCSLWPNDQSLIDSGGGYHLGAPNIRSDQSPSLPSSILCFPLIAPPGLQLCQPFNHLAKPHRTSIIRKGPYHERIPTTHLLPIAYTTKHSKLSLCFFLW